MANSKKAITDSSAEFLSAINELHRAASKADFSTIQTKSGTLAKGIEICPVYFKVRPFLEIILKIPVIIPGPVKDGIRLLMSALDTACPKK